MKEEDLVKFNFALPYIFLPRAQQKPQYDTIANVVTEVNGKGATFEFDWQMDDLEVRPAPACLCAFPRFVSRAQAPFRFSSVKRKGFRSSHARGTVFYNACSSWEGSSLTEA